MVNYDPYTFIDDLTAVSDFLMQTLTGFFDYIYSTYEFSSIFYFALIPGILFFIFEILYSFIMSVKAREFKLYNPIRSGLSDSFQARSFDLKRGYSFSTYRRTLKDGSTLKYIGKSVLNGRLMYNYIIHGKSYQTYMKPKEFRKFLNARYSGTITGAPSVPVNDTAVTARDTSVPEVVHTDVPEVVHDRLISYSEAAGFPDVRLTTGMEYYGEHEYNPKIDVEYDDSYMHSSD